MDLNSILMPLKISKEWQAAWNGHVITVRNSMSEHLFVDGVLADSHGPSVDTQRKLRASLVHEGVEHAVLAHIGMINGLQVGCHIYVDGQLIGGDTASHVSGIGL